MEATSVDAVTAMLRRLLSEAGSLVVHVYGQNHAELYHDASERNDSESVAAATDGAVCEIGATEAEWMGWRSEQRWFGPSHQA